MFTVADAVLNSAQISAALPLFASYMTHTGKMKYNETFRRISAHLCKTHSHEARAKEDRRISNHVNEF